MLDDLMRSISAAGITQHLRRACESLARLTCIATLDSTTIKDPGKFLKKKMDEYFDLIDSSINIKPGQGSLEKAVGQALMAICKKALADLKATPAKGMDKPSPTLKEEEIVQAMKDAVAYGR